MLPWCQIKSSLHRNYSSLSDLPLRSLRSLRLNHSDATGIDINNCSALKKKDYLLTLVDFLWYILDNGSGGKNNIFATTPIIRLYLIKCSKSSV